MNSQKLKSRMYSGVRSWNPYKGCDFHCVYCKPSFQRQAKRQRKRCEFCYRYEPHFHPELLNKVPKSDTVFCCAFGDIWFAKMEWIKQILEVIEKHEDKEFYLQTKQPLIFHRMIWNGLKIPKNVILGITLETNRPIFDTPSEYKFYKQISKAPSVGVRWMNFTSSKLRKYRKFITIEPILDFDMRTFIEMIKKVKRLEFVYVGYDNHSTKLPEPSLTKTLYLIEELEKFTEVRIKEPLRKAWYE